MATMLLPPEFKRLLSALSSRKVEYLVVGGYPVIFHGYVRTTGDLDIWVALNHENAAKIQADIRLMGYNPPGLNAEWFAQKGAVLRIGKEPLRFDIIIDIDGVTFAECYARRVEGASGRNEDLADLDYLP